MARVQHVYLPAAAAAETPPQAPGPPRPDCPEPGDGSDPPQQAGPPPKTPRRSDSTQAPFFLEDEVLYRQSKHRKQKCLFTVKEKIRAFWEAHVVENRHYSLHTTCDNLTKKYYWPRVSIDARKWIQKCTKCQDKWIRMAAQVALDSRFFGALRHKAPQMKSPQFQDRGLFSFASLQLFGPLKQTAGGYRFVFVAFDYFTKWVHAAPMQTCSIAETARHILELVIRFGLPEGIITTQLHGFICKLNTILKMALKIPRNLVVAYDPQIDWRLEDSKTFVRRVLTLVVTANPTDWDQHLHKVFFLQNRYPCCYEDDLNSLEIRELQEASSAAAANWPPPPCPPEAPPDGENVRARSKDTCFYCHQLPDEGDSDVFAVIHCDKCQAWVHDSCMRAQHGPGYGKNRLQCRACSRAEAPEAGQSGAGQVTWEPEFT